MLCCPASADFAPDTQSAISRCTCPGSRANYMHRDRLARQSMMLLSGTYSRKKNYMINQKHELGHVSHPTGLRFVLV